MPVVKWVFDDLTDSSTYTFAINPNAGGSPQYKKTINTQSTAAPDGKTLIFEGRDAPQTLSFSGVILDEDQYDAMVTWFNKRHQIKITDDLNREFMVYITDFKPRRIRAVQHPWKHEYEVDYIILDWDA